MLRMGIRLMVRVCFGIMDLMNFKCSIDLINDSDSKMFKLVVIL